MLIDYAASNTHELWNLTRLQAYLTNVGSPFDSGPAICGCPTLTPEMIGGTGTAYDTPATDDAPWYDPDVPESAEFLGFMPVTIGGLEDNPRSRGVSAAVGGGGVFGPARDLPRTITVSGVLIGTSCCGVSYGMHYMSEALSSCSGAGCDGGCLEMFSCCPDEGMTPAQFRARYRRVFRDTALTLGPLETNRQSTGSCSNSGCSGGDLVSIEFTLTAGTPWAWTDPMPVLNVPLPVSGEGDCVDWCVGTAANPCGNDVCLFQECRQTDACADPLYPIFEPPQPSIPRTTFCTPLVPERVCYNLNLGNRPRWSDDFPTIVINAGSGDLRNARVTFYESDGSEACDAVADGSQCAAVNDYYVSYIPAGGTITFDGQTQRAMIDCGSGCQPATTVFGDSNGGPVQVSGLDCASYCVCIETDSQHPVAEDASVQIEISGRGF